ncbi:hypothetical protein [Xylophilus sp. GOD-11R]|uniref:hypothetical protein n=1 Tax=Xylophilus sp. GOD-11R TaxID=3089814 RepID=UPI00298D3DE7|nr:hypothetical protein [Xylophilus sp. GOD-11R]WPB56896.1 hypothetical protein R9X41_22635 [Xylophilus sp. GOD-11R]
MNRSLRIILASLIGGLMLLGAVVFYQFHDVNAHEPVKRSRFSMSNDQEVNLASSPVLAAAINKSNGENDLNVKHRNEFLLEEARDYRVAFEYLLRDHTEKSGLYAMHILKLCTGYLRAEPMEASHSSRQDGARELMAARCASFSTDELSDQSRLHAISDPRLSGGLKDLWVKFMQADANRERRLNVVHQALAANDPLLLEYIGPLVMYRGESDDFMVAGKRYSSENGQLLINAWNAALCEGTGTQCGARDPTVLESCARLGICVESRRELVEAQIRDYFGAEGKAIFEEVYPALVTIVKTRDAEAFLPK